MAHVVVDGVRGVMVPVRIVVRLAPAGDHSAVPPPHTGPAVYYAVLNALRAASASTSWAGAIHDAPGGHKPVTLTPLLDEHDSLAHAGSREVRFEVGILIDILTAPMLVALKEIGVIRIARCLYRVADLDLTEAQPYPQLAENAGGAVSWSLQLVTPVAFETAREEGARRLRTLPEPEWVFGSLLTRWQRLAPETPLHPATAEAIASHLTVVDWSLRRGDHLVLPADAAKGRKELLWRGSIGTVTYRLASPETVAAATRVSLNALARFAAYGGVGDRTNVGMGYIKLQPDSQGR